MVRTILLSVILSAPRTPRVKDVYHSLLAMDTRVLSRPGWTLVALAGRLDMTSAGSLEQELETLIAGGAERLAIDLGGLDYLSSAGLRALLVAARRLQEAKGTLALIGLRGTVKEVLEIAGLANVFPSYASESELLAARPDWRR
jgi:anti-anti-sigma factor